MERTLAAALERSSPATDRSGEKAPSATAPWSAGPVRGQALRRRAFAWRNWTFALLVLAATSLWAFTLRPESLGGPTSYLMVRGVSMVPAYHTGDLVIVRRKATYRKGDVIAYRVPGGDVGAGSVVFHRIVGGNPSTGFVMQGDNNPVPDDWHPRSGDILGRDWLLIPRAGALLAFLHAPLPMASLAAGITVAILALPPAKARRK